MNARNVGRPPRGGASRGRAPAAIPPSAGAGSGAAAGESPPAGRGRGAVPRPAGLGGGAPQSPDASKRPYAAPSSLAPTGPGPPSQRLVAVRWQGSHLGGEGTNPKPVSTPACVLSWFLV